MYLCVKGIDFASFYDFGFRIVLTVWYLFVLVLELFWQCDIYLFFISFLPSIFHSLFIHALISWIISYNEPYFEIKKCILSESISLIFQVEWRFIFWEFCLDWLIVIYIGLIDFFNYQLKYNTNGWVIDCCFM
jgi:hypothetical protein